MPANKIECPHCLFEAPLNMFENVDGTTLKCRRCRNRFEDPNIYLAGTTYADCDSQKAVYRFPYHMNGNDSFVRVRNGHVALLVGHNGQKRWLKAYDNHISDLPEGFQVYYVCLKPWIRWGTQGTDGFGAYGMAQLSLNPDYPEEYCRTHEHILTLEAHLKSLVDWCVTHYIQRRLEEKTPGILEQRDGYLNVLGVLEEGVSITGIYPFGFRNTSGGTGSFPSYMTFKEAKQEEEISKTYRPPVEMSLPSQEVYTIRAGIEDVMIRGTSRAERHKADETIRPEQLKGVSKVFHYRAREFEFPYGWGISNQICSAYGFFSAHGTLWFYIDSTEKMSLLLNRSKDWHDFEEQLFFNVIKQEVATIIGNLLNEYIGTKQVNPENIRDYLSEMSIKLTNQLNGDNSRKGPAFSPFGLRVKRADILNISLYTTRR